ncbi:MAG: hypothetical protein VKL60_10280 [Sphaerospermopsis sp.]|uniref:Uncharacterized protein n=1 Tax=Sphaerospermopsis kisseleviana CS-549 TaxID=3021783 RepID=A0ABT4ZMN6_9CYAN|nr:hypothetical protein [Sphaerospermopsis kisseleviana]MDB9440656.1 hypothetical protein [Sphaerospermopsis kisseleviana CS-549]MEB3149400.1 hypothetical protein [Sphaerospermopsis sp.]BAZ81843.1 hypothetical protein NIES73_31110 [Sphaerospermopsis kisseleviana NIES-73]
MKKKKLLFLRFQSGLIITIITLSVLIFGSGNFDFLSISPAVAQRISPSDIWQLVYQQLPDLSKENQYISKETGKVAENNTLASRLIRYHIYVKGRVPIYRFDWKLTLADYLNANEVIYEASYPGNDSLKQNPLEGDRTAIAKLTRNQRNKLVQVLVNIFNTPSSGDR